jgi:hypothetical protein
MGALMMMMLLLLLLEVMQNRQSRGWILECFWRVQPVQQALPGGGSVHPKGERPSGVAAPSLAAALFAAASAGFDFST